MMSQSSPTSPPPLTVAPTVSMVALKLVGAIEALGWAIPSPADTLLDISEEILAGSGTTRPISAETLMEESLLASPDDVLPPSNADDGVSSADTVEPLLLISRIRHGHNVSKEKVRFRV